MRFVLLVTLLVTSLFPCALAQAQESGSPCDFRGIHFGVKSSTIQGLRPVAEKVVKNKERYKGVYYREDEVLTFGEASLNSVAYYFSGDKLRQVVVIIRGDTNAFLVKDKLISLYGQGRQVAGRYGWTWTDFSLVMERVPDRELSILTYTSEPRD